MTIPEELEKLLASYPIDADFSRVHQPKKSGGTRLIVAPNEPLRKWLKQVSSTLRRAKKDWPEFIHGGVRKRSYVSFVRPHINKKTVITLDIRKCFPSIKQSFIVHALQSKLELDPDLAKRLASKLCLDGNLPQGFATSNFLTNLYLNDTLLEIRRKLAKEMDFTIYVDDIAISGNSLNAGEIINLICIELSRAKLAVDKKLKIKVMHSNRRQVVVGLVLNKGISLSREKRLWIFSQVATKQMSQETLDGWRANINMFDKPLLKKLETYASKKGYRI